MNRSESFSVHTASDKGTERLGEAIGRRIDRGLGIALIGPLGAGKTVMARGLCHGLGVGEEVVSPTFILLEPFQGRREVVHIDLYRLEHENELEDLGVFDLDPEVVLVAEWADRSPSVLAICDVAIEIAHAGPEDRDITVRYTGELRSILEGITS